MNIPPFLDDSISFNLNRASLLLRRELVRALEAYGITPVQWLILVALWSSDGPITQKEIVGLTLKDKFTVSRIVKRLEDRGWVEKLASKRDGRETLIRPTAAGKSLKSEVPMRLAANFRRIYSDFSPEEKETLRGLLKKLRASLGDR